MSTNPDTSPTLVIRLGLQEIYNEQKESHKEVIQRVDQLESKFDKLDGIDNEVQAHGRSIARINTVLGGYAILQTIIIAAIVGVINNILGGMT